jgi:hypothetical protein
MSTHNDLPGDGDRDDIDDWFHALTGRTTSASPPDEEAARLRRALVAAAQKEQESEEIENNWQRLQRVLRGEQLKPPPKSPRNE